MIKAQEILGSEKLGHREFMAKIKQGMHLGTDKAVALIKSGLGLNWKVETDGKKQVYSKIGFGDALPRAMRIDDLKDTAASLN